MASKVLVIGSGGREHALGWKLAQSPEVSKVFYAHGNAGTETEEKGENIPIDSAKEENFAALYDFVQDSNIDMVVVGPEVPLANGIVNFFNSRAYHRIIGPNRRASFLESDKFFSYDLMNELGIPQARGIKCYSIEEAKKAIETIATPNGVVLKARGLTGGKGVGVFDSKTFALIFLANHAHEYNHNILVAERLFGQEFSVFVISDGTKVSPLEMSVQDHKPLLDNDKGPNTGGMGAYCPVPIAPASLVKRISNEILNPLVQRMKEKDMEYKGIIYAGMIMTDQGPKVLEFNIRFGDPENQPLMMMLKSDLYHALDSSLRGRLEDVKLEFNPGAACCVVLASQGYPGSYEKGLPISGLREATRMPNVKVFHAGTKYNEKQDIVTNGGRVLGVTAYSHNGLEDAQYLAYLAADKINIHGGFHCRKDVGDKGLSV